MKKVIIKFVIPLILVIFSVLGRVFEKIRKYLIPVVLLVLSVLFTYKIIGVTIKNTVISSETLFMPFIAYLPIDKNTDYFFKMFFSSDHSWFLVSVFHHLFSRILPIYTNNHPQYFYLNYGNIALFLIFYTYCSILSLNIAKYFKYRFSFLITFFIVFPFIMHNLQTAGFMWVLFNDTWFFCYILNCIFPLLLFVILEKNYVTTGEIIPHPPVKTKLNIPLVGILILIFLTGISHELLRFVFLGSLVCGLFLHKLIFKAQFKTNKIWYFLLYSVLMSCILFLTTSWNDWLNTLHDQSNLAFYISPAFKYFFEYVVEKNIWQILFIFIFSVINFFSSDNKDMAKRLSVITLSGLFSILIFNFVIIGICGEHLEISQHSGIIYLTKTIFSFLLFSNIGFLFRYPSEKHKNVVRIILALFLTVLISFFFQKGYLNTEICDFESKANKENLYMTEKAYDVYGKKHNVIWSFYPHYSTVDTNSIYYLKYWYGGNENEYKLEFICKENDSFEDCRQKFIDLLYKKSGYLLTEQEIRETNFSNIEGYKKQKRSGKIFVDFFN